MRSSGTLGMRARVTIGFGLGAMVLSVALSFIAYQLVRDQELKTEQATAQRNAFVSASLVQSGLRPANPDVARLLNSLAVPVGSVPVLYQDGHWFSTSLSTGRNSLPAALRTVVLAGSTATQRYTLGRQSIFAIGVPIPGEKAAYFELFDFSDLSHTLQVLFISLALAAGATTVAGAAVGRWASSRVLAPIGETARAAAAIAGGRLDIRLEAGDSDLADLASSFNTMVEALQRRMRRDARFTSDVSHELRSPLTTITSALQVMERRRAELPDRSAQALDLLSAEVRRFEQLVQDLLEISSADGGGTPVAMEEVDPGELIRYCVAATGVTGFSFEVDPSLAGSVLHADKRRVERIIANLFDNAASYAGGVVHVAVAKVGAAMRIVVDDAGPGITEDERILIFDRFTRGSASRRRGAGMGTGLGLSLVDEHVRAHHGRVWVEDRPGGGSRFCVELPLAEVPPG